MGKSTCRETGCGRVVAVRKTGLCGMHTYRLRTHGTVGDADSSMPRQSGDCSVVRCTRPRITRGLCAMHYARQYRTGDAGTAEPKLIFGRTCSVEGCGTPARSLGRCRVHARAWERETLVEPRECLICGKPIDFDYVHESGTRKKRNAKVCGFCPRQSVGYKWKLIRARDGDNCHLCDEIIDFTLKRPSEWSKSVDHVVPIAEGGGPELSNLKLSHLRCNLLRRTLPVEEARIKIASLRIDG